MICRRLAMAAMAAALTMPAAAHADLSGVRFDSIDGGTLDLGDWRGRPVLVVNTASQCGYTGQYADLQALHDEYAHRGLIVLAVPSDDFNQELSSAAEVKDFCTLNFNLTLPMADITHVKGRQAHPFYRHVRDQTGFVPRWNFNKVLIGPDGAILGTWGAGTKPGGGEIRSAILSVLPAQG